MDKITQFLQGLEPWISIGLLALAIAAIVLMIVFTTKYAKKKAYTKTLLKSIDALEKKSVALEDQVKAVSKQLEESQAECATAKSERHTLEEKLATTEAQLKMEKEENESLREDITIKDEKLAKSVSAEEHKKVVDELTANKKKSIKVDTLITKVEELTEKTKPVIKKVIKKEIAKLKKYSLEDLQAMYKHELMTLAQSLKLTGWTRYSKEKLVSFIYENLPKEQKKASKKKEEK